MSKFIRVGNYFINPENITYVQTGVEKRHYDLEKSEYAVSAVVTRIYFNVPYNNGEGNSPDYLELDEYETEKFLNALTYTPLGG